MSVTNATVASLQISGMEAYFDSKINSSGLHQMRYLTVRRRLFINQEVLHL